MKLVGLGGGIGAGKSSASARLARRGAVVVDADLVARQVVEPDRPALVAIFERFGVGVRRPDGSLDRAALAAIVFGNPDELAALNGITHPAIVAAILARYDELWETDHVVVLDAALVFDALTRGMVGRIVVDVGPEIAVSRLVAHRGFSEADAWARVASQMSREERIAGADFVLDNSGDESALDREVDRAWAWIAGLPDSVRPPTA